MISELTFVKNYRNFWQELLPGLDNFVRLLNLGLKEVESDPIRLEEDGKRRLLVNAVVSTLFENLFFSDTEPDCQSFYGSEDCLKKIEETRKSEAIKLARLDRNNAFSNQFNETEQNICLILLNRLLVKFKDVWFTAEKPEFCGCGLLLSTAGDLYYNSTIVEIKAGERYFRKTDLLQLLVYGSLNSIQEQPRIIDSFELYNPRMGLSWSEAVNDFSSFVSGTTIDEVYSEIVKFISTSAHSM